jgi:hypothetical protein
LEYSKFGVNARFCIFPERLDTIAAASGLWSFVESQGDKVLLTLPPLSHNLLICLLCSVMSQEYMCLKFTS